MTAAWSLNETEALARKAARGTGYDWGLAEEAGRAVRWLAARGLPGPEALVSLLAMRDTAGPEARALCPLSVGCRVADGALRPDGKTPLGTVAAPLLLVPFVAWATEGDSAAMSVAWGDTRIGLAPDGRATIEGDHTLAGEAEVSLSRDMPDAGRSLHPGFRARAEGGTFDALNRIAGRTYAPATEESRQSGAGAGLSDND